MRSGGWGAWAAAAPPRLWRRRAAGSGGAGCGDGAGTATGGDGWGRTAVAPVPFCSIITSSTAPLMSVASAGRGARWNHSSNAASRTACRPSDRAAASLRRDLLFSRPRRPRASSGSAAGIRISMAVAAAVRGRDRTGARTPRRRQAALHRREGPRSPDPPPALRRDAHNAAPGRARAGTHDHRTAGVRRRTQQAHNRV